MTTNIGPSFNIGDGIVTTDIVESTDVGCSVTVQPYGKILLAGSCFNGTNDDFTLLRYNTDIWRLDYTTGIIIK